MYFGTERSSFLAIKFNSGYIKLPQIPLLLTWLRSPIMPCGVKTLSPGWSTFSFSEGNVFIIVKMVPTWFVWLQTLSHCNLKLNPLFLVLTRLKCTPKSTLRQIWVELTEALCVEKGPYQGCGPQCPHLLMRTERHREEKRYRDLALQCAHSDALCSSPGLQPAVPPCCRQLGLAWCDLAQPLIVNFKVYLLTLYGFPLFGLLWHLITGTAQLKQHWYLELEVSVLFWFFILLLRVQGWP